MSPCSRERASARKLTRSSKPSTDKSYNGSVETIVKAMKEELDSDHPELAPSVIFGTHNNESVERLIASLESNGLATRTESGKLQLRKDVEGKIGVAQLYGKCSCPISAVIICCQPSLTGRDERGSQRCHHELLRAEQNTDLAQLCRLRSIARGEWRYRLINGVKLT